MKIDEIRIILYRDGDAAGTIEVHERRNFERSQEIESPEVMLYSGRSANPIREAVEILIHRRLT